MERLEILKKTLNCFEFDPLIVTNNCAANITHPVAQMLVARKAQEVLCNIGYCLNRLSENNYELVRDDFKVEGDWFKMVEAICEQYLKELEEGA